MIFSYFFLYSLYVNHEDELTDFNASTNGHFIETNTKVNIIIINIIIIIAVEILYYIIHIIILYYIIFFFN